MMRKFVIGILYVINEFIDFLLILISLIDNTDEDVEQFVILYFIILLLDLFPC